MPHNRPNENTLLQDAFDGKLDAVKAAVEAGASVDGPPGINCTPMMVATIAGHVGMVEFLLVQGADPDRPADDTGSPGERALHIAARVGHVEIVRLLLQRSHADPNSTNNAGCTPLMSTCGSPHACAEAARLLLEAGADPALADTDGFIPLHAVAHRGHTDLVDMLYSAAPATLNHVASDGGTPLFAAACSSHEGVVSKLLSLGAMERRPSVKGDQNPLFVAAIRGVEGVVRALINENAIEAVGGKKRALPQALYNAVCFHQAKSLQLLLAVDGEEGRSKWANNIFLGRHLLHYGAGYCNPAAVSILLEAGADEATRDPEGRIPREVIGVKVGKDGEPPMSLAKGIAIRRMLDRGPAYRARSWAWPSDEETDAGCSSDGDTVNFPAEGEEQ